MVKLAHFIMKERYKEERETTGFSLRRKFFNSPAAEKNTLYNYFIFDR